MPTVPEFYSQAEAAAKLNVSTKTIRRRIADGTLPAVRFGGLIRIPAASLASVGRPLVVAKSVR